MQLADENKSSRQGLPKCVQLAGGVAAVGLVAAGSMVAGAAMMAAGPLLVARNEQVRRQHREIGRGRERR